MNRILPFFSLLLRARPHFRNSAPQRHFSTATLLLTNPLQFAGRTPSTIYVLMSHAMGLHVRIYSTARSAVCPTENRARTPSYTWCTPCGSPHCAPHGQFHEECSSRGLRHVAHSMGYPTWGIPPD